MKLPVPLIDPPRRARAIAAHRPSGEPPLRVRAGQSVAVGRRDDEWPLWFRCRAADGREGWVPEAWLERDGGCATLRADYDATELEAAAGDELTVHRAYGGWLWAERRGGGRGWIPARAVQLA
jgi:SH3-like domain-containing protein